MSEVVLLTPVASSRLSFMSSSSSTQLAAELKASFSEYRVALTREDKTVKPSFQIEESR